jgi:hypothetical protein
MYCILKNIPISVFYHKKASGKDGNATSSDYSFKLRHQDDTLSGTNMLLNPKNAWFSGNIHHKRW